MFEINLNKVMEDLVSDDFETQCLAMASIQDLFDAIAKQSIKGFESSESPDLVIEYLANLGTIVTQNLENILHQTTEESKKTLVSIALLHLGSQKGVKSVISEFSNKGQYENLAILKLVKAKTPQVGDLIIERLRSFSLEELKNEKKSHYVNTLLTFLDELQISLPKDLEESFQKIRKSETYKFYSFPNKRG